MLPGGEGATSGVLKKFSGMEQRWLSGQEKMIDTQVHALQAFCKLVTPTGESIR